jgi:hypothetical protein
VTHDCIMLPATQSALERKMRDLFIDIIAVAIALLIPAWRIFGRAGFPPELALIVLVPYIGPLAAMMILAIAEWPAHKQTNAQQNGGI